MPDFHERFCLEVLPYYYKNNPNGSDDFEGMLDRSGITLRKYYLDISRAEQARRLQVDRPEQHQREEDEEAGGHGGRAGSSRGGAAAGGPASRAGTGRAVRSDPVGHARARFGPQRSIAGY